MVETLTKVATSSITNTRLALATIATLMAGGAALATVPLTSTTDIAVKEVNVGVTNLTEFIPVTINYDNRGTTRLADIYCTRIEARNNAGAPVYLNPNNVSVSSGFNVSALSAGVVCVKRTGTNNYIEPGKKVSLNIKIKVPSLVQLLPGRLTIKVDGQNLLKEKNNTGDAETNNTVTVSLPTIYRCADSDGVNYRKRGSTNRYNNITGALVSSYVDSCIDGQILKEGTCYGSDVNFDPKNCATVMAGGVCQNGECLALPDLTFNTSTAGKPPIEVDLSGVGSIKINYFNDSVGNVPVVSSGVKIAWLNRLGAVLTPAVAPVSAGPIVGRNFATAVFPLPASSLTRSIQVALDPFLALIEAKEYNNSYSIQFPCTETDGGNVADTKGKIAGIEYNTNDSLRYFKVLEDVCATGTYNNYVDEYYCDSNWLKKDTKICSGGCRDGACVPTTTPTYSCSDTDAGNNVFVAGTVTETNLISGQRSIASDVCTPSTTNYLTEYYCNGNNRLVGYSNVCPDGKNCSNGACVTASSSPVSCTDTDNGRIITAKGTTTRTNADGSQTIHTDHCVNVDTLSESYCFNGPYLYEDTIICSSNTPSCVNGACVAATSTPTTTTKLYINPESTTPLNMTLDRNKLVGRFVFRAETNGVTIDGLSFRKWLVPSTTLLFTNWKLVLSDAVNGVESSFSGLDQQYLSFSSLNFQMLPPYSVKGYVYADVDQNPNNTSTPRTTLNLLLSDPAQIRSTANNLVFPTGGALDQAVYSGN
ncbi:MAG: hypothetical protein WCT40_03400 [Candidatus Magasanikbacteria bacterium]|jgi:hypothetical protein